MISLIFAMTTDGLIGDTNSSNGLPWSYPEDLAFYKEKTIHKTTIMGRVTHEQIGRALPNRKTIVVTNNPEFVDTTVEVVHDLPKLVKWAQAQESEIMVVGGAKIFEAFIKYADRIYLTKIDFPHVGDVYLTEFDFTGFTLVESKKSLENPLTYEVWERINDND